MIRASFAAVLLVMATACGNSGSGSTTSAGSGPLATVTTTTRATSTEVQTSTTTTRSTAPAVAPYIAAVRQCQDATPVDLASKITQGTAPLQKAVEACKAAETATGGVKLTGPAGTALDDTAYALLKLNIVLDQAGIQIEQGQFDQTAQLKLTTAVLEFDTAASKMLQLS